MYHMSLGWYLFIYVNIIIERDSDKSLYLNLIQEILLICVFLYIMFKARIFLVKDKSTRKLI